MTWGLTCPLTIFDIQVVQTFLQNFNSLKILKSFRHTGGSGLRGFVDVEGAEMCLEPVGQEERPSLANFRPKRTEMTETLRLKSMRNMRNMVTCGDMWWHARTLLSMRTTHVVQPFLSKIWAHRQLMSVDPSLQIWFKANAQKVCFIAHHFSTFSILFLGLCLQNTMKLRFQSFLRNSEWRNWVPARMSWNLSSKREMQRCQTETKDA